MSKRKSIFHQGDMMLLNESLNERNMSRLFFLMSNLAMNRFVWEGLPQGLEGRHIEKALFEYGQCAFYDDDTVGLICLPAIPSNYRNVYGDPTSLVLHGLNYKKDVKMKDVVRIMNNDTCHPTMHTVNYYVEKMYKVDKAMDKNLDKIKTPYIIGSSKQNELTMKNLMKQIKNDEEEIYYDEKLTNGGDVGVKILDLNVPYFIDKLQQHKNDLLCEFLTVMGLNNSNANNNKKERLLVDEVNINNGEILMYLDVDFKNRKKACEEINKKFGLNVTVRKNIELLSEGFNSLKGEEGEKENGNIHNRGLFPFTR